MPGPRPPHKARLFLQGGLAAGNLIALDPKQVHYLLDVMRCRVGDKVLLFNGVDGEWLAVITKAERRRCELTVAEQTRPQTEESGPTLLFAPIKRSKLELLVEKATELGVGTLMPIQTRRSIVDKTKPARLAAITLEAAEQCGRLSLPDIRDMQTLEQVLNDWPDDHPLYVADETGGGQPLLQVLEPAQPAAFLIGPEGGFDPAELAALSEHPAVVKVDLGPRILRAETAGMMALACWLGKNNLPNHHLPIANSTAAKTGIIHQARP
ncbi:MAG: 16S rRNA (uracil(1498)-N(3))-methyltransferase [Geminicoccaceae bacterium]